jgi:hypothetical protein
MVTREQTFDAWVGSADRLLRIGKLVEDASRRAFEDSRAKLEALEAYERYKLDQFRVDARVYGVGSVHRQGELAAVLAEMDAPDIKMLTVSNSRDDSFVRVQLGGGFRWEPSVSVKVSGSDPQWVAATFEQLSTEISKGVPPWAWLRNHGSVAVGLTGALGFSLGLLTRVSAEMTSWVPTAIVLGAVAGWLCVGVLAILRRHVFVGFEVLEAGHKSTARRVGVAIVSAVSLISGLIAIVLWLTSLR